MEMNLVRMSKKRQVKVGVLFSDQLNNANELSASVVAVQPQLKPQTLWPWRHLGRLRSISSCHFPHPSSAIMSVGTRPENFFQTE